ncbi:hypothetical protein EST38_g2829 [Candolleomyces aberdarensis]|uniref:Fungal-type protein kinase domain-containing protein n=1 Tax=Candolleomyces aberdarensis TaxID=2316362 RepID=A0A4Q2DTP8_9AGAR|nr:hypothetical protein EST38_g2829 [Candolleomyces aberdarensis]
MEGDELSVDEQLVRVAIYARQLFIHQPNRRFVRELTLTGHHLRLFHFDRSGAQYTPFLDIHDDPHTFVRLVLGLSSPNESDIGLDTSIRWLTINGRKAGGALMTRGVDNSETLYPLLRLEPFFSRSHICGRSTTCWSVLDNGTDQELLVKSSWRLEDKTSEHVYLQEAVGTAGVVQMVSCEPDRGRTGDLRGFGNTVPAGFQNRVDTRVVIKCYGQPVREFNSPKQVLCALRDAIAGHMALVKKGTLHRDVSTQNIVLGKPGAEPGNRGVLIDFDMATHYRADDINPPADWRIGTRLYQSAMVLSSGDAPYPLPHSHLDDIESFFYVLTDIIHAYDQGGILRSLGSELKLWNMYDGRRLGTLKRAFLIEQPLPKSISSRWPKAFMDVFYAFRDFLRPIARQKMILCDEEPEERAEDLKALMLSTDDHYNFVIRVFDEGIAALEMAEAEEADVARPGSSSSPPATPTLRPQTTRTPLKRSSEECSDSQPALKRPKTPRPARIRHHLRSPPNLRGR